MMVVGFEIGWRDVVEVVEAVWVVEPVISFARRRSLTARSSSFTRSRRSLVRSLKPIVACGGT
jgi:hypothetical protein